LEWDYLDANAVEGDPHMESSEKPAQVLVIAHKTAATQPLLDAVRARAQRGPAVFTLLVPNAAHGLHKVVDPEDQGASEAQTVLDKAVPALSEAAGSQVEGIVGDPDPVAAVQDAINLRSFDEVIISTLSARLSRWLKLDLPSKVAGMGLPVTTVTPADDGAT
jgi:cell pole-organizing protein PopZ